MRNLKKTLCLVLALVFVLGLCTVGAADINFSDESAIGKIYKNAVTSMAGLGIIEGPGDGTFNPQGEVTRAQAAKFIAYMCLGAEYAEKLPKKQVFDDVTKGSSEWAMGYIAYCYNQGIINGVGNNKFAPTRPVKQIELCKMLLAACGYGKNNEYVGKDWDTNVFLDVVSTKLIKNLGADWDPEANATREQAALLTYDAMMSVDQVIYSKDSDHYSESKEGTYAKDSWNMDTAKGIIISNETSRAGTVKGIELKGYAGTYVTELDTDPAVLGHYVIVTFRNEDGVNKAYYTEDNSEEKLQADVKTLSVAADSVAFANGVAGAAVAAADLTNTANTGKFVVYGGKVVAYKADTYTIGILSINATTKVGTVAGNVVTYPDGAKNGDIVTVKQSGGKYLALATVKSEAIKVTQSQVSAFTGKESYNNGAIYLSKATNGGTAPLPTVTGLSISNFDGTPGKLTVGSEYYIWTDSEGGAFAYAPVPGTVAATEYVYLVAKDTVTGEYGATTNYAQVIKADGTVEKVVTDVAYGGTGVRTITTDSLGRKVLGAPSSGYGTGAYSTISNNPKIDLKNATYINYSGSGKTLKVSLDGKPVSTATVYYTYTTATVNTVSVQQINTVWFVSGSVDVSHAEVSGSYVYVTSSSVDHVALVDNLPKEYYKAYVNGNYMDDLYFAKGTTAPAVGFYTYAPAPTGSANKYTLNALTSSVADTTKTLVANSATEFFMNGKLYVDGSKALDLSNVKFVVLPGATTDTTLTLNSVEGIVAALTAGKTVTIRFPLAGTSTYSVGGNVIYVIAAA